MKYIILFFCFTYSYYTIGQIKNGKAEYKYDVVDNYLKLKKETSKDVKLKTIIKKFNKSIEKAKDHVTFFLNFSSTKSEFYSKTSLNSDFNKEIKFAKIFLLSGNKITFTDNKENIKLRHIEAYGENFIVKSKISDLKWKITSETKNIGKYICFKAETIKVIKNTKGTFKKKVTAWFSPKIPVNFGPKGYGGLPGLILELTEGNIRFYATKIKLNLLRENKIKKPLKGKVVSEEEFQKIGEKMVTKY